MHLHHSSARTRGGGVVAPVHSLNCSVCSWSSLVWATCSVVQCSQLSLVTPLARGHDVAFCFFCLALT